MKLRVIDNIAALERDWSPCTMCEIGEWAHKKVFYRGAVPCEVLFVGEAPGKTENLTGRPFVGRSGKILDKWITYAFENAGDFTYAIGNICLCRPCDGPTARNRAPTKQEVLNCRPRFMRFLDIAKPRVIVTLGRTAADHLPNFGGRVMAHGFNRVPVLTLLHPAALLYSREGEDSQRFKDTCAKLVKFLREELPHASRPAQTA